MIILRKYFLFAIFFFKIRLFFFIGKKYINIYENENKNEDNKRNIKNFEEKTKVNENNNHIFQSSLKM